jgi:hypothetical protein
VAEYMTADPMMKGLNTATPQQKERMAEKEFLKSPVMVAGLLILRLRV